MTDTETTEVAEEEIPQDPVRARYLRQMGICPPDRLIGPVVVIGAGATGSAIAMNLAKMGCSNVTVWDDDTLEEHNVSNQMCYCDMIGKSKVEALQRLVADLTGTNLNIEDRKYTGQTLAGIVITAVDNMGVRKLAWEACKFNPDVPVFIDPRMGGEVGRLYTIRPNENHEVGFYESNLYSSDEAESAPCSARAIIYCPSILAGHVAAQVKNFAVGAPLMPEIVLDIPGSIMGTSSEYTVRERFGS